MGIDACVGVCVSACVDVCVNVCVNVGVGLGLQVTALGLGVHRPSLPHTAIISPSGTNSGPHWNTVTEPSVVLVWGCSKDPLTGGGGAPQSAVCKLLCSYQSTRSLITQNGQTHLLAKLIIEYYLSSFTPNRHSPWNRNSFAVSLPREIHLQLHYIIIMHLPNSHTHLVPLAVVPYTAEWQGQVSRSY